MKKLRIVKVLFDAQISPQELPAFRGAIAEKVGFEHDFFHNHQADDKLHYRYPYIQYKCIYGNPAILCVDKGVDEIQNLFKQTDWMLDLNGKPLEMKIKDLDLREFTMQVWEKQFHYHIRNWIALNEDAYIDFQKKESLSERIIFLESILRGNILALAKGIDWWVEKPITVSITDLKDTHPVRFKRVKMLAFNLQFQCNVFIPNYIGLGRKVSVGYGMVQNIHQESKKIISND